MSGRTRDPGAAASQELVLRARDVRLLALDVDGVLTDAGMYYGPSGEMLKKFNTRDAMGLKLVRERGLKVAIITGEDSPIVLSRAAKLRIDDVFCGTVDKLDCLDRLLQRLDLTRDQTAYVGDDVNDLAVLEAVRLAVGVADAVPTVRQRCHYITARAGGNGAVREVCDLLLLSHELADDRSLLEMVR